MTLPHRSVRSIDIQQAMITARLPSGMSLRQDANACMCRTECVLLDSYHVCRATFPASFLHYNTLRTELRANASKTVSRVDVRFRDVVARQL